MRIPSCSWERFFSLRTWLLLAVSLAAAVPMSVGFQHRGLAQPRAPQAISSPVLKWQNAGCYSSWCETGWYSSPAVADLDNDGTKEIVGGTYTVFILNGEDGSVHRSMDPEGSRVWPGVVVADVDGDGDIEIVTAHGGGYVHLFDHTGDVVWSRRPAENELRGLSVFDLDDDGTLEIIVTGAVYGKTNTWVLEHDGALRPGWPQLTNDSGYAYGVFNDNAAVGDLDGDGVGEIVVPSDVHYICAYEANGVQIPAHPMYGGKGWGKVGVWESLNIELRGWGTCSAGDAREERYRANFAHGPAAIADVNGDGSNEVVAVGNVYDCISGYPSRYNGVYLFNADRSRFASGGYDWQAPPVDTGAPLSEDYGLIENNQPNPVVADLDGDGRMEIIYSSYDGRVHAFWLDKAEHGNWPYSVYKAGEGFFRFASEPVVADLDNNGRAEVIFGSWVQKGTHRTGKLHVVDYLGNAMFEVDLPPAYGSPNWNGALAAPTLADIDGDPDLEVVLNTSHSGFVAYDLPGSADARVLWGTGRGNYQRTASPMFGALGNSSVAVWPTRPGPAETLRYTITLENPGPKLENVRVTDTLPADLSYAGDIAATSGSYDDSGGFITWWGAVDAGEPVVITFGASVDALITEPRVIVNTVSINDGLGNTLIRYAGVVANGYGTYLPVLSKH
jgi:uncharacterized repeat protein (TIGR01451 family)